LGKSIAFLGNYLPRKCGIAAFTTDLCEAVAEEVAKTKNVFAIAMTNRTEGYPYPDRVRINIRDQRIGDYEQAADLINTSSVSVLCLQHEYGIYGGSWGEYLHMLLRKLKVPLVTTLHTVLENYVDSRQEKVSRELFERSDRLIVMSLKAVDILTSQGVNREKIVFIPHGVPDLPFEGTDHYKKNFDLEGKTVILTFGLISPNKGIEFVLEAMNKLVRKYPDIIYVILGQTHPETIKSQGEEYRLKLIRNVEKFGLTNNIFFHDRFVPLEELCDYLCATDIYVIPYLTKEQIISGTMAYALGAGKAIISTPTWSAEEMLSEGRGRIVPFRDVNAFVLVIDELLQNPSDFYGLRKKAYDFGRTMLWKVVARQYVEVFKHVQERRLSINLKRRNEVSHHLSTVEFPTPKLDHIKTLTDHFGIMQHARFTVPDYSYGYCVDDNARALIVATKFYRLFKDSESIALIQKYLAFLCYTQRSDGRFRNLYSITRQPLDDLGSDDCQGRALWGLGYVVANAPDYFWMVAKSSFEALMPSVKTLNLRGSAFATLGFYYYLRRYPDNEQVKTMLNSVVDNIMGSYRRESNENWSWFEDKLTYANGVIPLALWLGYHILEREDCRNAAGASTDFLLKQSYRENHISLVGCKGWHHKNDERASNFDQQPIDAMWLVELGKFSYRMTNDEKYWKLMRDAFDWFLGDNDVGVGLYDHVTGGCYDGLTPTGTNLNQGAESTLSAVLSLLSIVEISQK